MVMPFFKGFGGILGIFQNLIFAHSLLFFRGCQTCGEETQEREFAGF